MSETGAHLAGEALGGRTHVCAFFANRAAAHRALIPFAREGLDQGERVVRVVAAARRRSYLATLRAAGVDVTAAQASGALRVEAWRTRTCAAGGSTRRRCWRSSWIPSPKAGRRGSRARAGSPTWTGRSMGRRRSRRSPTTRLGPIVRCADCRISRSAPTTPAVSGHPRCSRSWPPILWLSSTADCDRRAAAAAGRRPTTGS